MKVLADLREKGPMSCGDLLRYAHIKKAERDSLL
jgi:hypothetical protein